MHRTDGQAHVGNLFNEGDPLIPRLPTQIDKDWLNAVQEELCNAITAASVALVKGTNNQLASVIVDRMRAQAIGGIKTFNDNLIALSDVTITGALNANGVVNANAGAVVTQTAAAGANLIAMDVTGKGTGRAATFTGGLTGGGINVIGNSDQPAVNAVQTANGYPVVCNGDPTSPARGAIRLVPQNADPSVPDTGALYVTTAGVLKIYNGSAWVVVGTQT